MQYTKFHNELFSTWFKHLDYCEWQTCAFNLEKQQKNKILWYNTSH